jgi:transposase
MLAPALRPGGIVVMDNLPAYKVARIRAAIEAHGAMLLYPPPYSPDFNPIENAFANLKAHVRKHDTKPLTLSKSARSTLFASSTYRMRQLLLTCRV